MIFTMKKSIYVLFLIFSVSTLTMCDMNFKMICVKQSIYNSTQDTVTVINTLTEFRGVDIEDTIICYPVSETVFFNEILKDQPLEPYDAPFIGSGLVKVSSGKSLKKNIFNTSEWEKIFTKDSQWLKFTITEDDLE